MNPPWRAKAACNGLDPTIFYPQSEDDADAEQAKSVYAQCPVQHDCLEYALGFREKEGVWGGATERERRRIIRQRRRAAYARVGGREPSLGLSRVSVDPAVDLRRAAEPPPAP